MMNSIIILLLFRSLASTEPQEKTRVKRSLDEFNKTAEVTNLEIKQDLSFATNYNF